jgi:hypothetical protein
MSVSEAKDVVSGEIVAAMRDSASLAKHEALVQTVHEMRLQVDTTQQQHNSTAVATTDRLKQLDHSIAKAESVAASKLGAEQVQSLVTSSLLGDGAKDQVRNILQNS